jgi:7,8-dihydroneopterin aldolase/epimerase/oxygenase
MTSKKNSSLSLRGLELKVFLGWPAEERAQLQTVSVDIEIEFATALQACVSDNLDDTFCYNELIQTLEKKIAAREFHLLEHLAFELYQAVKQTIQLDAKVGIHVKKMPAIPQLTGGAIFYFGD